MSPKNFCTFQGFMVATVALAGWVCGCVREEPGPLGLAPAVAP